MDAPIVTPAKKLSFLDFMTVDLTGQAGTVADPDGMLAWQYQKRHRMTESLEEFTESYKSKLAAATGKTKEIADHLAAMRKKSTAELRPLADQSSRIHSARSKNELIDVITGSKFGHKQLAAHDEYFWGKDTVAEQTEEDNLTEALTTQQRLKRRILFKRIAPKIKLGKERASRRKANNTVLQKRAVAMARSLMSKKLLAGKSKGEVSFAERVRVEKIIAKRGKVVQRIATKLLPFLRKKEAAKFSSAAPVAAAPTTSAN
jgi:hypothetical protein